MGVHLTDRASETGIAVVASTDEEVGQPQSRGGDAEDQGCSPPRIHPLAFQVNDLRNGNPDPVTVSASIQGVGSDERCRKNRAGAVLPGGAQVVRERLAGTEAWAGFLGAPRGTAAHRQ